MIFYQFVPIPQKLISIHLPLCYWYKRSAGLIQRNAVINEPFKRDKFQQVQQELVICFHTLFSSSLLRPLPGVVLVCVGEELCKRVSNISFCLWSLTVSSYVKYTRVYVSKRCVYSYIPVDRLHIQCLLRKKMCHLNSKYAPHARVVVYPR